MEFGAQRGKSEASAARPALRGSASLFCLTHTGCLLLYICIKSDLTTSGQLNAKARTHAGCTHWGINPRSGFSGPHSAVAWGHMSKNSYIGANANTSLAEADS